MLLQHLKICQGSHVHLQNSTQIATSKHSLVLWARQKVQLRSPWWIRLGTKTKEQCENTVNCRIFGPTRSCEEKGTILIETAALGER